MQELKAEIDAGHPVPLGLKSLSANPGEDHVILAVGYDTGRYKGDLGDFKEDLKIFIYDPNNGAVMKTLQQRRAIVLDTGFARESAVIRGVAPIGEMFGFLTALRSQTQGRGSYMLEPLDYRPLPDNLTALHHDKRVS